MESTRFFVTNLSPTSTKAHLNHVFRDYGEVVGIEVKKKISMEPANLKLFAFVTLEVYGRNIELFLKQVNSRKINGEKIEVSLAKESFLDKLKRERETSSISKACINRSFQVFAPKLQDSRKIFYPKDLESYDKLNPLEENNLNFQNEKIIINALKTAPYHIINGRNTVKRLNKKATEADEKRKKSFSKLKSNYKLKKLAIQQSLSGLEILNPSRILFNDNNEATSNESRILKLFDSGAYGNDYLRNNFNIKAKYYEKNAKKLEINVSLDPRFKINSKFVDEIEDKPILNENNEINWQKNILCQNVESKIVKASLPYEDTTSKQMFRFYPSNNEYQKLIWKNTTNEDNIEQNKNDFYGETNEKYGVSQKLFYNIKDGLSQSFKTKGNSFSILSMFGKAEKMHQKENLTKQYSKIHFDSAQKIATNPFKYDSSDSEYENKETQISKMIENTPIMEIILQPFFIIKNDIRLKDGIKFFKSKDDLAANKENYEEMRNRLKLLIKKKIRKTKRQTSAVH